MSTRWAMLTLLCLARVSMGLHLQTVAAVAPFLLADLGLSYAEVGLLIGLFLLPGALLALPGGLLSGRLGDNVMLLIGLGLLTLGTGLLALSPSLAFAAAARLLSGAGGALVNLQVAKMVTAWFAGLEIASAMGVMLAMFPLGIALVLAGLGTLAAATSWHVAVAAPAAVTGLTVALVALLYRDPPREGAAASAGRPPLWSIDAPELRLVLVAGVGYGLLNGAYLVFTSFMPTLLLDRGRSQAQAGALVSWTPWVTIVAVIFAGYLLDRAGRAIGWLVLAVVAAAGACFTAALSEPALLWLALFGVAVAPAVVGMLTLPADALRPESRPTGFGLFYTLLYLGFASLPPLAGALLDVTRSAAAPMWLGGALLLAVVPTLLAFRALRGRVVQPTGHVGDGSATPAPPLPSS